MRARILGAHQCQSADRHFASILVDEHLAIDAGSLASALTIDDQLKVQDVLLTHGHWDHLKDLGGFGYNLLSARSAARPDAAATIHCTDQVRDVATRYLLVQNFWMDFFQIPGAENPVFRFDPVGPNREFPLGDYRICTIPVPHGVPVQGYQITAPDGQSLYYTGDNGEGSGKDWATARPDLLITECTYSDQFVAREGGKLYGHLSPSLLRTELDTFRSIRGYFPRVVVVHINPFSEDEIRPELATVARDLGASIEVGYEGMELVL